MVIDFSPLQLDLIKVSIQVHSATLQDILNKVIAAQKVEEETKE
jgi:hypothetical protein